MLGAGVLPSTSREEKSVWVVSVEGGPRSWERGGREARRGVVLVILRREDEGREGLCGRLEDGRRER